MNIYSTTEVSPYFILYLVMMFVYNIAFTMIQTATITKEIKISGCIEVSEGFNVDEVTDIFI